MKLPVLLCSVLLTVPVWAQETHNGAELLVAASNMVAVPDEFRITGGLPPAEALKRKRGQVAKNAPALEKLREAFQYPIVANPGPDFEKDIEKFKNIDKLTQQLRFESEVRVADGDWAGALNSRLTNFELGAILVKAAPIVGVYGGELADSMGGRKIETIVLKADAATLRSAVERLKAINAKRISFAEYTESEKANMINMMMQGFADEVKLAEFKTMVTTPEGRKELGVGEDEAKEFAAMTPEVVKASISEVYDAKIARDRLPYALASKTKFPQFKGTFAKLTARGIGDQGIRFDFESNLTKQRLLEAAMELRAIKLEKGAYPETFTAPLDPFGDASLLHYQRIGDSYLLYSVGPDGKDGDGEEIQTVETDDDTGMKTVTGNLTPRSTGDILGPVF